MQVTYMTGGWEDDVSSSDLLDLNSLYCNSTALSSAIVEEVSCVVVTKSRRPYNLLEDGDILFVYGVDWVGILFESDLAILWVTNICVIEW